MTWHSTLLDPALPTLYRMIFSSNALGPCQHAICISLPGGVQEARRLCPFCPVRLSVEDSPGFASRASCHCLKLSSSSSSILVHEQGSRHQSMSVLAVQCLPSQARTRESIWGLENHESFETKMQKDSSINISMFCNQLLYSLIVIQLLGKLMRSPGCVKAPELWCTDFRACGGVATLNPSHMG